MARKNRGVRRELKSAGSTLSRKEAKQIAKSTGSSVDKVINRANKSGLGIESGAANLVQQKKDTAFLNQALGSDVVNKVRGKQSAASAALTGKAPGKNQTARYTTNGGVLYDRKGGGGGGPNIYGNMFEEAFGIAGGDNLTSTAIEPESVEDPYAIDFESFFNEMAEQQNAWAADFASTMDQVLGDMEASMGGIMEEIAGGLDEQAGEAEPTDIIRGEFETGAVDSATSVPEVNGTGTEEVLDTTNETGLAIADATGVTGIATPDDVTTQGGLSIGV
jgi:hypothetical protein